MFCTKSPERDRGESAVKESFIALTRMGFKTLESTAILNLRKYKVIGWLKSDANFCEEIKSIPTFGNK